MVQSPNPRRLVIFGGRIKTSQRPSVWGEHEYCTVLYGQWNWKWNILRNHGKLFPVFAHDSRHFLRPFFIIFSRKFENIEQGTMGSTPGKICLWNKLYSNNFKWIFPTIYYNYVVTNGKLFPRPSKTGKLFPVEKKGNSEKYSHLPFSLCLPFFLCTIAAVPCYSAFC